MYLTQTQQLKRLSKIEYKALKELMFYSKNIYNVALYNVRQEFFETKKFLSYNDNCKLVKDNENYQSLQAGISQQIIKKVNENFKSFFALLKAKSKGKIAKDKKIRIPHYKEKDELFQLILRDGSAIKNNILTFPLSRRFKKDNPNFKLKIKIPKNIIGKEIKQIRINPKQKGLYFEVLYIYKGEKNVKTDLNENNIVGIDLGLNNLATVVANTGSSIIIDGKKIKSINQYYNKTKAKLYSKLNKNKQTESKKTKYLNRKRNNIVKDYMAKSARQIIDFTIKNKAKTLVLGYNKEWKKEINIGKKNNQNFVNIPFLMLKNKLEYLCEINEIELIITEESYTSKCSFFDNEDMKKQDKYLGTRIKRGLFKTSKNYIFNADINGALNIIRKVKPENQLLVDLRNKGFMANPKRIIVI